VNYVIAISESIFTLMIELWKSVIPEVVIRWSL